MSVPSNNIEERKTLWVGDVQTWMDETYLRSLFQKTGHIQSVKIMRDKVTNQPVGYGFVEFTSHEVAAKVLQLFTGSINPATNKPFKLNWGVYGGSTNAPTLPMSSKNVPVYRGSHHPDGPFSSTSRLGAKLSGSIENKVSVYVGDMDITINQDQLLNHFLAKCPTALSSKIIVDPKTQLSKGYGFVTFASKEEADAAITLMDGSKLRGKAIKCRPSYIKTTVKTSPESETNSFYQQSKPHQPSGGGNPGGNYGSYQNPANNALPKLSMEVSNGGGSSGRRTSGFLAMGREDPVSANPGVPAMNMAAAVGGVAAQQQLQQLLLQYQQVLQQQRILASQPALLSNPIYYQQYITNQAFLTSQGYLAQYIPVLAQQQQVQQIQQIQEQPRTHLTAEHKNPEIVEKVKKVRESRYFENPLSARVNNLGDDRFVEENEGMEIENVDEINSSPKLAIYKFIQEYGMMLEE